MEIFGTPIAPVLAFSTQLLGSSCSPIPDEFYFIPKEHNGY